MCAECLQPGPRQADPLTSPGIHDLGAWLEQLRRVPGKLGTASSRGPGAVGPQVYGRDRIFAYLRFPCADPHRTPPWPTERGNPSSGRPLTATISAVVFRWEIATAVAIHEDQSLRSAGRGGEQGGNAGADRCL
jgi:hypothetical protein